MTYSTNGMTFDDGVFAVAGGIIVFVLLFCLAIAIVSIIGKWKMFTKAGEEGWKAIIPIYNSYIQCKITGVNPWWILIVCLSPIIGVVPIVGSLAQMAVAIYYGILIAVSTANSFGKDTGFAVGLFLLEPIFDCILGFGSAKYEGAKPMNDVIFKNSK